MPYLERSRLGMVAGGRWLEGGVAPEAPSLSAVPVQRTPVGPAGAGAERGAIFRCAASGVLGAESENQSFVEPASGGLGAESEKRAREVVDPARVRLAARRRERPSLRLIGRLRRLGVQAELL